jgi:hypothetical protein
VTGTNGRAAATDFPNGTAPQLRLADDGSSQARASDWIGVGPSRACSCDGLFLRLALAPRGLIPRVDQLATARRDLMPGRWHDPGRYRDAFAVNADVIVNRPRSPLTALSAP